MHSTKIAALLVICLIAPLAYSKGADAPALYQRVDIEELLSSYSERTGTKFVLDPRVKGKIETIGAKPGDIDQESLIKILKMHNFATIEGKNFIYVVPQNIVENKDGEFGKELGKPWGK